MAKARELGCTVTVLLLSALSIAIGRKSQVGASDVIGIFLSVDLRPYFGTSPVPLMGNFAITHMIRIYNIHEGDNRRLINEVAAQLEEENRLNALIIENLAKVEMPDA